MLEPVEQPETKSWWVRGVVSDPAVPRPPLGRYCFRAGPHLVGFDDNFVEPIGVHAYYDLDQDPAAKAWLQHSECDMIGYVQICQLTFCGTPVHPAVFGGRLADRSPYVVPSTFCFVDFMGPSDVWKKFQSPPGMPFYPYNGILSDANIAMGGFAIHPQPNGSMMKLANTPPLANQSPCASLSADTAPGLLTPAKLETLVGKRAPLAIIPYPLGDNPPPAYRVALDHLENQPLPAGAEPPLKDLVESQLTGRVIGDFELLTLPDPEDLGATLCVRRPNQCQYVIVHLLSFDDMSSLEAEATGETLKRLDDALRAEGLKVRPPTGVPGPGGRGRGGLSENPLSFGSVERVIELNYLTCIIGNRPYQFRCVEPLSGFVWSVQLGYDEDIRRLRLTSVRQPSAPPALDRQLVQQACDQYLTAINLTQPYPVIDASNFTRAAMRRDRFAPDWKLQFVDQTGG